MLSIKNKGFLSYLFICLFLITRIAFLGYDEINPDAVNWHFRSEQFIVGLKSKDFFKTHQHYHPGVTLMWIMGIPIEIYRQINPQDRVYNENNFILQHKIAKYSLITVQLVLTLFLIYVLSLIFGYYKSLLAVFIMSFEPWFLGNSRLLHMDALLSLLASLSICFTYVGLSKNKTFYVLLGGIFGGLSFLTKSVGLITLATFPLLVFFTLKTIKKDFLLKGFVVFYLSLLITIFIFFPALWVKPKDVLLDIYNEGLRVGTRRGHEQIVLGEKTQEASYYFYMLVLILKASPIMLGGTLVFTFLCLRNALKRSCSKLQETSFLIPTFIIYLTYFVLMSLASKKVDRYITFIFPLLGIFSAIGYFNLVNLFKKKKVAFIFPLIAVTGIVFFYQLIAFYPYYFTYTNPLFGSAQNANKIIGQKPFGIGIWEVKEYIQKNYKQKPSVGFIDRKPMSMIYPNSKIFDIREYGPGNYDLIILGPNEEMTTKVLQSPHEFKKVHSIYINNLEYWRIYEKIPQQAN